MVFILVPFLFHLEIPKRVFVDPFVPDAVKNEILNTTQQVDRPVRLAMVCRLQKRVEAVDIGIVQGREQNIVLFCIELPYILSGSAVPGDTCSLLVG